MKKYKHYYNGDSPKNARIKIDYSVTPAKATFEYPDKKNQVTGSMFGFIFLVWVLFTMVILFSYEVYDDYDVAKTAKLKPYVDCYEHFDENYEQIITNTCFLYAKNTSWRYPKWNLLKLLEKETYGSEVPATESLLKVFKGFLFLIVVLFGPPLLIYLPFKKKWNKLYPRVASFFNSKKMMFFYPKTPFKDEKEMYFEVPYFNNVQLTYKATKDFSKYLRFIEIHEYPFYTWKAKTVKKKCRFKKYNEFVWYARFYYSNKPKSGELEVLFR